MTGVASTTAVMPSRSVKANASQSEPASARVLAEGVFQLAPEDEPHDHRRHVEPRLPGGDAHQAEADERDDVEGVAAGQVGAREGEA